MILRIMTVSECWCEKCHSGQMEQIHDIMMAGGLSNKDMVGRSIQCKTCGHKNVIEDILNILPTAFLVSTESEINKYKANEELKHWFDQE